MTICVPKRPFEIFGLSIVYGLTFSWIVTLPLAILDIIGILKVFDSLLLLMFGGIAFYISLLIIHDWNKEHHWIEWCVKQPNLREDKQ